MRRDHERGAALFVAILLLLILTVLGVGLLFTASIEQTLSSTETKISKIFYAADSGIEYAGSMLATTLTYAGGPMPVGVSSHYPGLTTPDMQVTISPPIFLGDAVPIGEQYQSEGDVYESNQIVENIYAVTSSARSTRIEASKTIEAEVGIYPKQRRLPE